MAILPLLPMLRAFVKTSIKYMLRDLCSQCNSHIVKNIHQLVSNDISKFNFLVTNHGMEGNNRVFLQCEINREYFIKYLHKYL